MTDRYRETLAHVSLALLTIFMCVFIAAYFGARAGATIAWWNAMDELDRSRLWRRKPSSAATGGGNPST